MADPHFAGRWLGPAQRRRPYTRQQVVGCWNCREGRRLTTRGSSKLTALRYVDAAGLRIYGVVTPAGGPGDCPECVQRTRGGPSIRASATPCGRGLRPPLAARDLDAYVLLLRSTALPGTWSCRAYSRADDWTNLAFDRPSVGRKSVRADIMATIRPASWATWMSR